MSNEIETYSMSVEEEKEYYKELYQEMKAQVKAFMHYRELYTIMSNRIDKAIEYIENKIDVIGLGGYTDLVDIKNILKGVDKE